ncbi:MAG: methylated-DNA--[protein]-cysteine S-methyltransferase [Anaerolineae bacterium]|jgi:methylated-DNA-[protein]-cysteine S-methyltransferase
MEVMLVDQDAFIQGGEIAVGYYASPIGLIEICGSGEAITSLRMGAMRQYGVMGNPLIDRAVEQLAAYFRGARYTFDLPIALVGTEFQHSVWEQILTIPYGQTQSYSEVARILDKPRAVRAVGAAAGQNPISIIVPCHRVIGSHGDLVGYGGGLWRKEWLLQHEGALLI